MPTSKQIQDLLQLANNYPSPHNGQPIRLRVVGGSQFELYFERSRGLQATDISFLFSYVSMGVFTEHLVLSAEALGHRVYIEPNLPQQHSLKGEGPVLFAVATIKWAQASVNEALLSTLQTRQTARSKYYEGPDTETAQEIEAIARKEMMDFVQLNAKQTQQAIWLNQRAVFDDLLR